MLIALFTGSGTPVNAANPGGFPPGCTCVHLSTGQGNQWQILFTGGVAGLVANSFNTILLASPLSVTVSQWLFLGWECSQSGGGHSCLQSCTTGCGAIGNFPSPGNMIEGELDAGSKTPSLGISIAVAAATSGCGSSDGCITGLTFSSVSVPTTTVDACYGNCGTPAVTLANTNSTHGVNWNTSITLFYEFQVASNGFMLNITTNLAKNYPNTFYSPLLAWYSAICAVGQLPFTAQCPGSAALGADTATNLKGRASLNGGSQYAVSSSSVNWYGVALTFRQAPEDVNDTNAQVQLFQTSGQIPLTVTSSTVFSATSKIGIWAWVRQATTSVIPPPTVSGPCTNNWAQLDCLLPALSNGQCLVLTPGCQTSGSLMWILILTILSFLLVTMGFSSAHVTRFVAAGDVFLFFFLTFFFMFAGIGLIVSFVIIFFLFIGATIFSRTARQYF